MLAGSRLVILAAVVMAAVSAGCGGDGDDSADQSEPTSTSTIAASPSSTQGAGGTPGAGNPDEKTPGPGVEETPGRTLGATAPPPATEGTPAVEPPDTVAYLMQFQGRGDLGEESCTYDPSTRVTDCGPRGVYSVRPPLGGQDIFCTITIIGSTPEFIRCTSAEPSETKWYDIQ
jgi:hypothetical protein